MVPEEEQEQVEEGAPAWMTTYSDLATLLLTFFVLLLSFANMDVMNFKEAMGSVQLAMGVQFEVNGKKEGLTTHILELSPVQSGPHILIDDLVHKASEEAAQEKARKQDEEQARKAAEEVKKFVQNKGLDLQIEVEATPRGVVLRARDTVLFDTGHDSLREKGTPVLDVINTLFQRFTGELSIQGHTDSVPINTARFPSNWELSTARAVAVMRYLNEEHNADARRIQVAGYADTKPLVNGNSAETLQPNRRVEFLFQFPVVDGKIDSKKPFKFVAP